MRSRRGRHRWLAVALLILLAGPPVVASSPALSLTLHEDGLSSEEHQAAQVLIGQAQVHFPDSMVAVLPPLTLEFTDLPARVHGRLRGGHIRLARHLLQHDDAQPQALVALLHELGHALDRELALSRDPRFHDLAGIPRTNHANMGTAQFHECAQGVVVRRRAWPGL